MSSSSVTTSSATPACDERKDTRPGVQLCQMTRTLRQAASTTVVEGSPLTLAREGSMEGLVAAADEERVEASTDDDDDEPGGVRPMAGLLGGGADW